MSNQTVAVNSLFVNETPMVFWEGAAHPFDFVWMGQGTISSATFALYRNKENVSATYLSTTTGTVTGRVVTSGICTFTLPGDYLLLCSAVEGSNTHKKALKILVSKIGVY